MNIRNNAERSTASLLIDVYLKYEKIIIPVFLVVSLSSGFYYLDWHNNLLFNEGVKFFELNTFMDRAIPFSPAWVWVYVLYYPFCFMPLFLLKNIDTFRRVAGAFLAEFVLAFIVFLALPVKMLRPDVVPNSLSTTVVAAIYRFDPGFNVFPSMHVANSLLVALIFYKYDRRLGVPFMAIAVLISLSTMFVKQHYALDVFTGALDSLIVFPLFFKGHVTFKAEETVMTTWHHR